jgi:PPOX class probable F420-dependent enzyme
MMEDLDDERRTTVRMGTDDAYRRLVAADHGVLATLHHRRAVDLVPVCYVVHERQLVVPIDTVKAKSTMTLQRRTNLESDPRATLLVEAWDREDWTKLWWVRAELEWAGVGRQTQAIVEPLLREKYVQYRDTEFVELLGFWIRRTSGWRAGSRAPADPETPTTR